MRRLRVAAVGLGLLAGTVAVSCNSASSPTTGVDGSVVPSAVVTPEGFETASVRIRRADGSVCELCTYVARTGPERQQGLMNVTDLAGHDGMLFVLEAPAPTQLWMKNTVLPLSAAWFGADGSWIASFDMEPCAPASDDCERVGPSDPALHLLEVPQGDLTRLGIGVGAVLESVGPPCEPTD